VVVEEETEETSESLYSTAAEDADVDDDAREMNISQLKARREQLAKQVAEQVCCLVLPSCLNWIFSCV